MFCRKSILLLKKISDILIFKYACSIVVGEVSSLAHEGRNDAMEKTALVVKRLACELRFGVSDAVR